MSPYHLRRSTDVVTRSSNVLEAQRGGSHSAAKGHKKRKSVAKMSCRKKESVRQVLQDDYKLQNMVKVTSKKVYRSRKVKKTKVPLQSAVVMSFDENMNEEIVVLSHQESPVKIKPAEATECFSDSVASKEDDGDRKVTLDLTKASDDLDKNDIINALTLAVNLLKVNDAGSTWAAFESVAHEWKAGGVDQRKDVYNDDSISSQESRRDESLSLLPPDPNKFPATVLQCAFTPNDDECDSWIEVDDLNLMQTFNPALFEDMSSDDIEKVFEQDTLDGLLDFISDYPEKDLPLQVFSTVEAARLYLLDDASCEVTETLNVVE